MMMWTADELGAFLDWCEDNTYYGPVFDFYATTGMRPGVALGLSWEDIDLRAGTAAVRRARIVIEHRVSTGPTKSGRARVVELDGRTVAILMAHKARHAAERLRLGAGYATEQFVSCRPLARRLALSVVRLASHEL